MQWQKAEESVMKMEETEGVFVGHKVRKADLYSVARQLPATVCSSGALVAGLGVYLL